MLCCEHGRATIFVEGYVRDEMYICCSLAIGEDSVHTVVAMLCVGNILRIISEEKDFEYL